MSVLFGTLFYSIKLFFNVEFAENSNLWGLVCGKGDGELWHYDNLCIWYVEFNFNCVSLLFLWPPWRLLVELRSSFCWHSGSRARWAGKALGMAELWCQLRTKMVTSPKMALAGLFLLLDHQDLGTTAIRCILYLQWTHTIHALMSSRQCEPNILQQTLREKEVKLQTWNLSGPVRCFRPCRHSSFVWFCWSEFIASVR